MLNSLMVIHIENIKFWAQTAAHPQPYIAALNQVSAIEKKGGAAEARRLDDGRIVVAQVNKSPGLEGAPPPVRFKPELTVDKPITPLQQLILDSLPVGGAVTSVIASTVGKPVAGTHSALKSLSAAGRVVMTGVENGLHWKRA